jgi:Domain of unknown function (DUF4331)
MSSHREAPQISKDPTADSTDLYAFVSPDRPDTVTLIANYIPLELPDGGPNFYEFADDVLYSINIDNDGDGRRDIAYQFRFTTVNNDPDSFLYNDGPITALSPPASGSNWNRQQTYSLTRVDYHRGHDADDDLAGARSVLGRGLLAPPCNIGPRSTPHYADLANQAIHTLAGGVKVFAGQRAEGFYVDLGSLFDLGGLRPFNMAHLIPLSNMPGVNSSAAVNVHSLALQVPIEQLTANGSRPPTLTTTNPNAVIGVWTTARRQKVLIHDAEGSHHTAGPFSQVSRLGNPLVNELIIGIDDKDRWNSLPPLSDGQVFFRYFANPLLPHLLADPKTPLYPGVFPNLAAYNSAHSGTTPGHAARPDLVAVLLSGIPQSVLQAAGFAGVVPPTNVGGTALADMLRLNVAQPPTQVGDAKFSIFGYLEGDGAGFPNGRRVYDDVATIELRAVAGATLPLVAAFTPDTAVGTVGTDPRQLISFGLTKGSAGAPPASLSDANHDITALGTENYLNKFPYLGTPYSGYATPSKTPSDKAS